MNETHYSFIPGKTTFFLYSVTMPVSGEIKQPMNIVVHSTKMNLTKEDFLRAFDKLATCYSNEGRLYASILNARFEFEHSSFGSEEYVISSNFVSCGALTKDNAPFRVERILPIFLEE